MRFFNGRDPERIRLFLAKAFLLFVILGLLVVEKRKGAFPIVNWQMFSYLLSPFPESTTSEFEFHAITADNRKVILNIYPFYPFGREIVARGIVHGAFSPEKNAEQQYEYQRALWAMVNRAVPGRNINEIEVWRTEWEVDPLATPPLDLNNPTQRVLVGRLGQNPQPIGGGR